MNFPSPRDFKAKFSLPPSLAAFVQSSRHAVERILNRTDPRLALIIGPCSIHNLYSALEYARRVKALSDQVADSFLLVMRVYVEKPRTAPDWKGFLYDPDVSGSEDLVKGIALTRQLMVAINALGVPIATEFLDPLTAPYFSDLVSWGFIGARTSASQPHRQLGSLLEMPVGFKNGVDGNTEQAIYAVQSARLSHHLLTLDEKGAVTQVTSRGNPLAHIVLRGGSTGPNYDAAAIREILSKLEELKTPSPLIIDCSHGNCERTYEKQKDVFYSILEQKAAGGTAIAGAMLESHLEGGSQKLSEELFSSVSITDPCLDWVSTEGLILSSASRLMSLTHS